jgi:hypothetical protein
MSESTIEQRETVTERADRFKTRKVRIYEMVNGRSELVDTRELSFTKAMKLKCERGGVVIEGLDAWVDEHKGRLRIKQRVIEDLLSTEGFARNIIAWANYDDYVLLVAAKDLHIGGGLTIYEGEEFWFPASALDLGANDEGRGPQVSKSVGNRFRCLRGQWSTRRVPAALEEGICLSVAGIPLIRSALKCLLRCRAYFQEPLGSRRA